MRESSQAVNNEVLSVTSLNRLVRDCLENAFPLTWVSGEISNLTYAASGHVYFSLKDAAAQVRCVMWRSRAQLLGWRLENGQKIEARVLVSFYEPRGEFQLNVEAIRRAGQGDLFERFLQLKARLESEGLFAPDRKRPLPAFPKRLAIVTSPQAAALRDVLTTLQRRAPHIGLTLFPTPVQGEGAGARIAAALAAASASDCDAVILCRGGGSLEDLWAFNEECVARALRDSKHPVVCGVGHETDFTIADFAADVRAPTPTAAAELISPDRNALLGRLEELRRRLALRQERLLADAQQRLDGLASRLTHPAERLQQRRQSLGLLTDRLSRACRNRHDRLAWLTDSLGQRLRRHRPDPGTGRTELNHRHFRLQQAIQLRITQRSGELNALKRSLKQLDPHAVLGRGYALATGPDGRIVRDASSIAPGERLNISLARGTVLTTVDQVVAADEAE